MPHPVGPAAAASSQTTAPADPETPITWIVTRHPGALRWLSQAGWQGVAVTHFDPQQVRPGDQVIGTLPVQLAAAVCAHGGRYWHLTLDVPAHLRGQEMSTEQMQHCGARLEGFRVEALRPTPQAPHPN